MRYEYRLVSRLLIAIIVGVFFDVIYAVFTPLTIYPVFYALRFLGYVVTLGSDYLMLDSIMLKFVEACIAASAYYLLLLLILLTKDVGFWKSIKAFLTGSLLFLILNISRIIILVVVRIEAGANLFSAIHLIFWNVVSTAGVFLIWLGIIRVFKIKAIPIYSDIKHIIKNVKN